MKLHAESNGSSIRYALCSGYASRREYVNGCECRAVWRSGASRECVSYSESTANVIAVRPYDVECVAVGRKLRNNNTLRLTGIRF